MAALPVGRNSSGGRVRLVEVEWVDAHVHDRWVGADDLRETAPALCVSVGYLAQDEPEFITLAQSIGTKVAGGVEEYGQPITIPRAALISWAEKTTVAGGV